MEQMTTAMSIISGISYGVPAGLLAGMVVPLVRRHRPIDHVRASMVITGLAAIAIPAIWFVFWNNSITAWPQSVFWGWFIIATLVVAAGLQWLLWLLNAVTAHTWAKKE